MKNKKILLAILAIVLVLGLVLAGCAIGKDTNLPPKHGW
jgi:hypothetical protein